MPSAVPRFATERVAFTAVALHRGHFPFFDGFLNERRDLSFTIVGSQSRNSRQVICSISRVLGWVWFTRLSGGRSALAMRKIVTASAQQKIFVVRAVVGDGNLRMRT